VLLLLLLLLLEDRQFPVLLLQALQQLLLQGARPQLSLCSCCLSAAQPRSQLSNL
jgi:hypothetical protein